MKRETYFFIASTGYYSLVQQSNEPLLIETFQPQWFKRILIFTGTLTFRGIAGIAMYKAIV